MDIWTVDKATIRAEIRARNALRRSALLPLLDEQKELEHACRLIRNRRWSAFKGSKQAAYERFRDEVYAERGGPSGMMGRWARHIEINNRFEAFLHANCADEIAAMLEIAPDYLAITRETVEADPRPRLPIESRASAEYQPVGCQPPVKRHRWSCSASSTSTQGCSTLSSWTG